MRRRCSPEGWSEVVRGGRRWPGVVRELHGCTAARGCQAWARLRPTVKRWSSCLSAPWPLWWPGRWINPRTEQTICLGRRAKVRAKREGRRRAKGEGPGLRAMAQLLRTAPKLEPAIVHETHAGRAAPCCTHGTTASCWKLPPMQERKETAYRHGDVGPRVTSQPGVGRRTHHFGRGW